MSVKNRIFYQPNLSELNNRKSSRDVMRMMKIMKKLTLIVIRLSNGEFHESRPCNACLHMLKSYEVKHVYYSTKNKVIYENSAYMDYQHTSLYYRRKYSLS